MTGPLLFFLFFPIFPVFSSYDVDAAINERRRHGSELLDSFFLLLFTFFVTNPSSAVISDYTRLVYIKSKIYLYFLNLFKFDTEVNTKLSYTIFY